MTQNLDATPQLGSSDDPAETSKTCEQNVHCVPLGTSEAENCVENVNVLPQNVSGNGLASANGTDQTCKDASARRMLRDLRDRKGKSVEVVLNGHNREVPKPTAESGTKSSSTRNSGFRPEIVLGLPCQKQFETMRSRTFRNIRVSKKSHEQRSSSRNSRVLKSESQGKSKEPVSSVVDGKRERNRGREKAKGKEDDEYARIKRKLRYLLNRINYEQSLINAYSSEGWKGLSLEKLRPEKELERATKEILRRKLRIRELFHHLGSLLAEGKLPESVFDSEGEIDSEDIFCAKCGSKDMSRDNDIVLCDGVCDRGFHQFCLDPPLRKEDIPPGDEGWLCPGCDCKLDCIDLLNELLGTKLAINDSWEKIFPEAAAGDDQNQNLGLASDDSDDDDDYNPDGIDDEDNDDADDDDNSDEDKEAAQSDESSDESDFTSASDEMVGASEGGQDMNLSSDDSEDDDYDPDAPTRDDEEDEKEESSSSDFTSDSEDLGTLLKDHASCQEDEVTAPGEVSREKSKLCGSKEQSVMVSEPDTGNDGVGDVPRRRANERLDYKKLYDEAYGHVRSSSSDDEDWDKTDRAREDDSDSEDEITRGEEGDGPSKESSHAKEQNRTRKRKLKSKSVERIESLNVAHEGADESGSLGEESGGGSSTNRKLRTQRLSKIFHENRYPDATTKENLARELQMTVKQVNNWFRNRRTSTNTPLIKVDSKEDVEKLTASNGRGLGETSLTVGTQHTTKTESAENMEAFVVAQEGDNENGPLGKESGGSSSNRKLRSQRLFEVFQENRYPDVTTKENLARELQMTAKQVNNWFRNRRSSTSTALVKMVSKEDVRKLTESNGGGPGEMSSTGGGTQQTAKTESAGDNKKALESRKRRRR